MAKRTRGSRRDRRRGARPTTFAAPPRPMPATPAAISATTDAAPEEAAPTRIVEAPRAGATALRPSSRLSATADEYRYVTLDLRRIAAVIGTLLAAMLGLWVAIDVLRVISL